MLLVKAKQIATEASNGNYRNRPSVQNLDSFFSRTGMVQDIAIAPIEAAQGSYEFEAEFLSLLLIVRLTIFEHSHSTQVYLLRNLGLHRQHANRRDRPSLAFVRDSE